MSSDVRKFPHRMTVWPVTGKNVHSEPTYGDPVVVRCRHEEKVQRVDDPASGQSVVSSATFFIDGCDRAQVATGDAVSFGRFGTASPDSSARPVIMIDDSPTLRGNRSFVKIRV